MRRPRLLDTKWKVTLASLTLGILRKISFEIFFFSLRGRELIYGSNVSQTIQTKSTASEQATL